MNYKIIIGCLIVFGLLVGHILDAVNQDNNYDKSYNYFDSMYFNKQIDFYIIYKDVNTGDQFTLTQYVHIDHYRDHLHIYRNKIEKQLISNFNLKNDFGFNYIKEYKMLGWKYKVGWVDKPSKELVVDIDTKIKELANYSKYTDAIFEVITNE